MQHSLLPSRWQHLQNILLLLHSRSHLFSDNSQFILNFQTPPSSNSKTSGYRDKIIYSKVIANIPLPGYICMHWRSRRSTCCPKEWFCLSPCPQWPCDLAPTSVFLDIHWIPSLFSGHHPIRSSKRQLITLLHYLIIILFHMKLLKLNTTIPPYPPEICSKTPGECLKHWIVQNLTYTRLFPTHACLWKFNL